MIEGKHAELQKMQERVAQAIAEELRVRKEVETKLQKSIEEKSYQIKQEIAREADSKTEVVATLQNYLEVEIPQLYEGLRGGINEREQTEEMLLRQISEEF